MTDQFADYTTLGVGGPIGRLITVHEHAAAVAALRDAFTSRDPWMVLGGGSNLLVSDEGFDGTVIRLANRGIEVVESDAATNEVIIRAEAGENWDDLVAWTVAQGYAGLEAMSGIPGSVGAAPVQNIGAYGQELSSVLRRVEVLVEGAEHPIWMSAADLELGYRTSILKEGYVAVVLRVEIALHDTAAEREVLGTALSAPIVYAQLAAALDVQLGDRAPLAHVRDQVRALRASKGMLLDPADPDSRSAGSFFTNPIVTEHFARTLPSDAPRWPLTPDEPDEIVPLEIVGGIDGGSPLDAFLAHQAAMDASAPAPVATAAEPLVKLSAAWLIEHAGIRRGFALPGSRAAISSKHTLALTNRGGATADEIAELARFVQTRVASEFGIDLRPEPVLVGVGL
ncbi:MAG TPA: UDP-N-acetylmuramate dehydrogenase [Candidatus Lumbricidophila sp.]|nr:UDP-N-acetylmuramate dehydrogenase [Candidatus Lumbricidophila sp.]